MFRQLILVDFALFVYLYICLEWYRLNIEQAFSHPVGFMLFTAAALVIVKFSLIKPYNKSKIIMAVGMALLIFGFAASHQFRSIQNFILVEGHRESTDDISIDVKKIRVNQLPGLIRNNIYADIEVLKKFDENFNIDSKTIEILPKKLSSGYWRIIRFGYLPIISVTDDKTNTNETMQLLIANENWNSELEKIVYDAGLTRNPPPRMMLGVGTFPPEMETIHQLAPNDDKFLALRLSNASVGGKTVSLENEDYWRYVAKGRLLNPILKVNIIEDGKSHTANKLKIGDTINEGGTQLSFNDLRYWVELERRQDHFLLIISLGLVIIAGAAFFEIIKFVKGKIHVFKART